jgi:hypothetical protein
MSSIMPQMRRDFGHRKKWTARARLTERRGTRRDAHRPLDSRMMSPREDRRGCLKDDLGSRVYLHH